MLGERLELAPSFVGLLLALPLLRGLLLALLFPFFGLGFLLQPIRFDARALGLGSLQLGLARGLGFGRRPRACCGRGGSLEMARRKEFTRINDEPSSYDTNNPINVAA